MKASHFTISEGGNVCKGTVGDGGVFDALGRDIGNGLVTVRRQNVTDFLLGGLIRRLNKEAVAINIESCLLLKVK